MGRTYISFFETSIRPVGSINVLKSYGFRHGLEGNVANALSDFLRSIFVLVHCSKFDEFLLKTYIGDDCDDAMESRSKSSFACVVQIILAADLSPLKGIVYFRDFAG